MTAILAFFPGGAPGLPELIIFGTIALLLFGKRLPEVARSLGKGIVEFKKGVRGIEDEVSESTYRSSSSVSSAPRPAAKEEVSEVTAPKFEPPKFDPSDDDGETKDA
ncbi:MAG: twin-arginine translocase TatA/TatE family subunit [Planctomycetota bacterium]|nr:twin-arginine translocase TatA/TatE family subunit [Planctomycetota bacterium]MDA1163727.1 twin-arginine translocase TatA/TatE family subunit [Planctomycetota bacterium]